MAHARGFPRLIEVDLGTPQTSTPSLKGDIQSHTPSNQTMLSPFALWHGPCCLLHAVYSWGCLGVSVSSRRSDGFAMVDDGLVHMNNVGTTAAASAWLHFSET